MPHAVRGCPKSAKSPDERAHDLLARGKRRASLPLGPARHNQHPGAGHIGLHPNDSQKFKETV
jgi:hypothetical protein